MLNLDEFTMNLFEDIRDSVPIIGSNSSANIYHDDSLNDANGLVGNDPFQSSSLPFSTASATNSEMMFLSELTDVNEHPSWDTVALKDFESRPSYLGRTPHRSSLAAISDPSAVNNALVPLPTIARSKRRMTDESSDWHTSKRSRIDSLDAAGRIPSLAYQQPVTNEFLRTYDYTEGNALRQNNLTTRTFDCEEIFPAVDPVPVAVRSSAQGLWPMMTSSTASQRRPTQMPYMTAEYCSQKFPLPFSAQPLSTMIETNPQFNSMPYMTTEYRFNFSLPPSTGEPFAQGPSQALSWGLTQQLPQQRAQAHQGEIYFQATGPSLLPGAELLWPASAAGEDTFPSSSTPFETTAYGLQSSLAPVVRQHSQVQPVEQQSLSAQSRQHSTQARHTCAPCPRPLPIPVAEPSFDSASETSASSSSGAGSSKPAKKQRKKPQTPFLLAEAKCHLCNEGFKRGSELHHHWTTNKHRLREREVENPGVIVTVDDLTPNCFCPSCGKGYTTPYVVKRHLKKCAGQAGSSQGGSQEGEEESSGSTA